MQKLVVIALICATSAAIAGPNGGFDGAARASLPSTPTITGTATVSSASGCAFVEVTVSGEVTGEDDLGGGNDQIRVAVWDDGTEEDFEVVDVPVGETIDFSVTLGFEGLVGDGADGVGVYITDGPDQSGTGLYSEDPFIPEEVAGNCPSDIASIPVPVNSPVALAALITMLFLLGMSVVYRKF